MSMRITKARIQLMLDEPFFGTLLMGLEMIEDPNIPTMCTDGERIRWSPAFLEKITDSELCAVLAHEVLHVALLHMFRRQTRDPFIFNVAADYVINWELEKNGRFKLPKDVLRDQKFANMSAEEVYEILIKDAIKISVSMPQEGDGKGKSDGDGQGDGKGKNGQGKGGGDGRSQYEGKMIGDFEDPKGSQADKSQAETRAKVNILQAAQAAKNKGDLPAEIQRLVDNVLNPKKDWRELLREFVTERSRDDYSFTRPNPRYIHTGFMLPSLYSNRLGKIAVAVDTSGSIGQKELNEFLAEIEAIASEARPMSIILMGCDAAVSYKEEFIPGDKLPTSFGGGGGTDFRPVFKALQNDDPVCLIYLTDLCGTFPDKEASFPTLWATTYKGSKAPFGITVEL